LGVKIDESLVPPNVRAKQPNPLYIVTPDGCWEWQGTRSALGYGQADPRHYGLPDEFPRHIRRNGQHRALTHRISYWQNIGPIPEGKIVRHTCDNPPCVNPAHLLVGTRHDNAQDRVDRRRTYLGRSNRTVCRKGEHPLSGENLRIKDTQGRTIRVCRACERESQRRRRRK
jgi:hypothetical protein